MKILLTGKARQKIICILKNKDVAPILTNI